MENIDISRLPLYSGTFLVFRLNRLRFMLFLLSSIMLKYFLNKMQRDSRKFLALFTFRKFENFRNLFATPHETFLC